MQQNKGWALDPAEIRFRQDNPIIAPLKLKRLLTG
jgi:hypothetical protein